MLVQMFQSFLAHGLGGVCCFAVRTPWDQSFTDVFEHRPSSSTDRDAAPHYTAAVRRTFPRTRRIAGCPPTGIALDGGIGVTIHAGEEASPSTIAEALDAGAQRIGVAYSLRDDIAPGTDGNVTLGPVAGRLLEEQTPVEMCPTSDGALHGIRAAHHHFEQLYPAGLNLSLNTDNRLVSGSTMTGEFELAVRYLGLDDGDLRQVTHRAIDAAFCDDATKSALRSRVDAAYVGEVESNI